MTVVVASGSPGLVPVIVSMNVPRAAPGAAVMVSIELGPVGAVGLKLPVTPCFMPLTDRVTGPVKPALRPMAIATVVLDFRETLADDGADSENDAGAITVKLTVVVCVSAPLVPVIVSV